MRCPAGTVPLECTHAIGLKLHCPHSHVGHLHGVGGCAPHLGFISVGFGAVSFVDRSVSGKGTAAAPGHCLGMSEEGVGG